MNQIFQLTIAYGEWDSYSEETIFVHGDIDRVRETREELKHRATDARVRMATLNQWGVDDIFGWVAHALEDGVTVRLEAVTLGKLDRDCMVVDVLEQEDWLMPQYKNMEDVPWEGDDLELHRYEEMAEPWEQRFLG